MSFSKQAHEVALAKVAAADAIEVEHAVDYGFAKAAREILHLDDNGIRALSKIAVARLEEAKKKLATQA